ncbi:hypothetical protein MMPV_008030 [Pyropia vietnamensis]
MGKKRGKTAAARTRSRPPAPATAAGPVHAGGVGGIPPAPPLPTRPDVEALVATAAAASARLDFPAAVTALTAAVAASPTDAALHEALAVALLEGGEDPDAAAASLRRSIELAPDVGGSKYLYLAQLAEADPPEAFRLVRSGIRNMRAGLGLDPDGGPLGGAGKGGVGGERRETSTPAPAATGTGTTTASQGVTAPLIAGGATAADGAARADALRHLCSAYCAAAEVLLALAEAEGEPGGGGAAAAAAHDAAAEAALAEAAALGGNDGGVRVEAGLGLANLRLSQGRRPEAKAQMRSVCRALVAGVAAARAATEATMTAAASSHAGGGGGGTDGAGWEASAAAVEPPALELRIAAGKQAVEVGLYRLALAVLGGVVEEEDRNVEVWYLLAWSHARLGEVDAATAALGRLRQVVAEGDVEGVLEEDLVDRLEASLAKGEKIVGGEASDADSEAEADDDDGGGMDTGSDSEGD